MKKISLFLILAATITSACGSSQEGGAACSEQLTKEYSLSESYLCTSGCDEICNFDNLGLFESSGGECNFLSANFEAGSVLCGKEEDCAKTDLSNISIAWGDGDTYSCEGEEQVDGVHLRCVKNPFTENTIDCQEAIFQKAE